MSKNKLRNLFIVLFVGLFFMNREPVFMWLLVGAIVLFYDEESKPAKLGKSSYDKQIRQDARTNKCPYPRRKELQKSLRRIYSKREQAKRHYPQLADEYDQIVYEMWHELEKDQTPQAWIHVLREVERQWPVGSEERSTDVFSKMKEVQEKTRRWQSARDEAFGGESV